jgi:hypothetical protein
LLFLVCSCFLLFVPPGDPGVGRHGNSKKPFAPRGGGGRENSCRAPAKKSNVGKNML